MAQPASAAPLPKGHTLTPATRAGGALIPWHSTPGHKCWTKICQHNDRLWWRLHRPRPSSKAIPSSAGATSGWVIPEAIVMCESSGQNLPPNEASAAGYYQIISSSWAEYGGSPPDDASQHSKAEQDAVAARIWASAGPSAWVCKG